MPGWHTMGRMSARGVRWPGYAAAVWGLVFAVPSFVWALGSTAGAQTTVSPSLVKLAQDRVTWFVVVLWVTGVLKVVGALVGLGLTRRWGTATGRLLVCCGWGAAVLLVWHGLLFVIGGVLVETGVVAIDPALRTISRWYLYLWGPWFVLGGLAFGAAAWVYVRTSADRRGVQVAGFVGGLGALGLSVIALLGGVG
jgi:Protein of unknown function (DUF3995)